MIRVSVNVRRGERLRLFRDHDFAALGQIVVDAVRAESRAGRDATGRQFAPYADRPGERVDLTDTGRLLASVRLEAVDGDRVVVGVGAPYAGHVARTRPFFGISPTCADRLADHIDERFTAYVARTDIKARSGARGLKSEERVDDLVGAV